MGLKATTLVPRCCFVSQKQKKMVVAGYDLNMSNITDHILALSLPAGLLRCTYRNLMMEVKEVLEKRHSTHYKVYNLCTEQDYNPSHFNDLVESFPFDDNHAPSLPMIKEFCESVHSWLSSGPKNIVFINCMASKGRIGLMVSSYLVYKGMSAEEALQVYADKSTTHNIGMMTPSQLRYVNYWQKSLSFPEGCPPEVKFPKPCSRELRRIRLYNTKIIQSAFFVVSEMKEVSGQRYRSPSASCRNFCFKIKNSCSEIEEDGEAFNCLECNFGKSVQVTGDVCVTFYEKNIGGRLFNACFNTAFIENNSLQFSIAELDKVGYKCKSIAGPQFCVELIFGPTNPNSSDS